MAKFVLHSLVGIGFPSAKAPIVFLDFVPSQSYDRSKSKKLFKILTRFSILARLISHISKTNAIQEFNFTLAYLPDDLLPDGEKHLKIRGCL